MKKKVLLAILCGSLAMGAFTACGSETEPSAEETAENSENAENAAAESEANETESPEAEADDAYEAGRVSLYGLDGQKMDLEAAYAHFEKALELGKTEANFYLGVLCDWEPYPKKDYGQAKAYYEAAGENPYAQIALGFLYLNGMGIERDEEKAQELFDNAIAQGCADGYYGTAVIAESNRDYTAKMEDLNKVVEEGTEPLYIRRAFRGIGYQYFLGTGVEQDYAKAMEWYEKAVEQGDTTAMTTIGSWYRDGAGVEQDSAKAMEWYEKAVEQGDTDAMSMIGLMYANGMGVGVDYVKAAEWLEKAANLGNAYAMENLGILYEYGLGVEQDSDKAQEWYDKAAAAE
ncbi:MAG: sel1 repeat family protein [Blautia sp.]|nr:sel1 repeat family protein [Blautia sp.]